MNKRTKKKLRNVTVVAIVFAMIMNIFYPVTFVAAASESVNPYENEVIEILISDSARGTLTKEQYINEMTNALKNKGYKEENIIFHDADASVNTSNLNGWYLYDHYYNPQWNGNKPAAWNDYNGKQPFFYYKEAAPGGNQYFPNITDESLKACYDRSQHIWAKNGGKDILFVGYSAPNFADFAMYPALNNDPKTVEFDIEATQVNTHTLYGAGFLFNAGIDENGIISGYTLFYQFNGPTSGTVYIGKLKDNTKATDLHAQGGYFNQYFTPIGSEPFQLDVTSKKSHIKLNVAPTSVKCEMTDYKGDGSKGTPKALFGGEKAIVDTKMPNFGPIVGYTSHSCSQISMFTYSNLNMEINNSISSAAKDTNWKDDESKKVIVDITDKPVNKTDLPGFIKDINEGNYVYVVVSDKLEVKEMIENELPFTKGTPNPSMLFPTPKVATDISNIISDKKFNDAIDPTVPKTDAEIKGSGDNRVIVSPTPEADVSIYDNKDYKNPIWTGKTDSNKNSENKYEVKVDIKDALNKANSNSKEVTVNVTEKGKKTDITVISTDTTVDPYVQSQIEGLNPSKESGKVEFSYDFPSFTVKDKSYSPAGNELDKKVTICLPDGRTVDGTKFTFDSSSPEGEYRVITTVTDKTNKKTSTSTKIFNVAHNAPSKDQMNKAIEALPGATADLDTIKKAKNEINYAGKMFGLMKDQSVVTEANQTKLQDLILALLIEGSNAVTVEDKLSMGTQIKNPNALFTKQDIEDLKAGKKIDYKLIVSQNPSLDYNAQVALQQGGLAVSESRDNLIQMDLYKYINNSQPSSITELTKPIRVTVNIPQTLLGKSNYQLVNIHRDMKTGVTSLQYYKDLDNDDKTITVDVDKFSPFLIVYDEKYTIDASADENGTISPSGKIEVLKGKSQNYEIKANTGYDIADVLVDGVSVGAVSEYNFEDVSGNHTIAASFKKITFTITAYGGENGTISPSGKTEVAKGGSQKYEFKGNQGYKVEEVWVDGVSVGAVSEYNFKDISANHIIAVKFKAVDAAPKTGDNNNNTLMLGGLLVVISALVVVLYKKRQTLSK